MFFSYTVTLNVTKNLLMYNALPNMNHIHKNRKRKKSQSLFNEKVQTRDGHGSINLIDTQLSASVRRPCVPVVAGKSFSRLL